MSKRKHNKIYFGTEKKYVNQQTVEKTFTKETN